MNRLFFALIFTLSLVHSTARAGDLLERDCKGKTSHGDKIKASLQVFGDEDGGEIIVNGKGYGPLDFKKETKKGLKYESDKHGGIEFKVDFQGRYVVGESDKLGKFSLTCHEPRVRDDDDSDHDLDLPNLYFSTDSDG